MLTLSLAACGGGGGSGGGGGNPPAPTPAPTFTVGGTVSGLAGSGLVLASGGSGTVAVSANGAFTLPTGIVQGTNYAVTVSTQPASPSQTCTVTNGAAVMGAANVTNVAVACVTNNYTVGGTVTGLAGTGLALRINGGGQISAANGAFTFVTPLASGTAYTVSVATQPVTPYQTCALANAGGTVGGANVTNVTVTCTTNNYSVRGTASGIAGTGLTLQINAANDLLVSNNGGFEFPNAVPSGQSFTVTVKNQPLSPAQTCLLSNATGSVTNAAVDGVELKCTTSGARFAYVGGSTGIYCYGIDGVSRALFPLANPLCASGALNAVAVEPSGKFAYGVDSGTTQVIPYSINQATGALTPIAGAARATGANPIALAVLPNGRYLYVANANANTVSVFAIDVATGGVEASGAAVATGTQPNSVTIDRTGGFLYLTNGVSDNVSAFRINAANGALSAVAGSPFAVMAAPRDVAIDPSNRYAYVTSNLANRVHAFSLNSTTGALTQIAGSPFVTGTGPMEATVDPSGTYLYVTNLGNTNSLSAWTINATTGGLTAVAGSPFARTGSPWGITANPAGGFLYIANSNAGTVTSLSINATTGATTDISSVTTTGSPTGTFGIAISP